MFYSKQGELVHTDSTQGDSLFYKGYNSLGQLMIEGLSVNGNFEGEVKKYFQNGKVKASWNSQKGERNGQYLEYFVNGQLKTECYYQDGELTGKYRVYFPNGQLEKEGTLFVNASVVDLRHQLVTPPQVIDL